jgi:hypothetical protein
MTAPSFNTYLVLFISIVSILELLDYYLPDIAGYLKHLYQALVEMASEHCSKSNNENFIEPLDSAIRGAFAHVTACKLSQILVCIIAFRVVVVGEFSGATSSPAAAAAEVDVAEVVRTNEVGAQTPPRRRKARPPLPQTPSRQQPPRNAKAATPIVASSPAPGRRGTTLR